MTTVTETSGSTINVEATTSRGYALGERGLHNITKGAGLKHPFEMPKFDDKNEERQWIKEHMAGAFRVFARKGYTEGTAGHISVRDPIDPETFWINPLAIHFGLIKASDLVHVDKDGNILPDGNQVPINAAGFAIHSALHQARPDVHAACHTHSKYGKTYSALGKPLDMINQDVCVFYKNHAVYTDFGGVALEAREGIEIAKSIGNGKGAILQNHGLITVGNTVDEAAYLFTLMERSCECQLLAMAAANEGTPLKLIGEEEAAYTEYTTSDPDTLYAEFQPDLEWEKELNPSFLK